MKVVKDISGVEVRLDVPHKLVIIHGWSGTGKSFLFSLMPSLFLDKSVEVLCANATEKTALALIENNTADLIILDNADLYLSDKILDAARNSNAAIWVSLKMPNFYNVEGFASYSIKYVSNGLSMRFNRLW